MIAAINLLIRSIRQPIIAIIMESVNIVILGWLLYLLEQSASLLLLLLLWRSLNIIILG